MCYLNLLLALLILIWQYSPLSKENEELAEKLLELQVMLNFIPDQIELPSCFFPSSILSIRLFFPWLSSWNWAWHWSLLKIEFKLKYIATVTVCLLLDCCLIVRHVALFFDAHSYYLMTRMIEKTDRCLSGLWIFLFFTFMYVSAVSFLLLIWSSCGKWRQQNNCRTWELQQRGKNGQSAEEVADLMWVYEHDTKAKTEELAALRVRCRCLSPSTLHL